MLKLLLIVLFAFTLMLNSCSKNQGNSNIITPKKSAREKSPIPISLEKLDKNSEELYQSLLNKDWIKSEKDYQKVQEEFYNLSPYLIKDSIPNDYISALEFSMKNLEGSVKDNIQIESLTESNNITYYMCDVADYFITDYPGNLRRIHVFTRNVEINALQDKWDGAKENFRKVNAFWPKVKDLLSAKSTEKVKAFEESLIDFEYLLNKKDLSKVLKHTQTIRDKTAELEKYYEN
jgi:hypothetical protein